MFRKAISTILVIIMFIFAFDVLHVSITAQEADTSSISTNYDWSGLYYDYILDHIDSMPDGDYTIKISDSTPFSLHDFDTDGVPELMVGAIGARVSWNVFTIINGSVTYTGGIGGRGAFFSDDINYQGLFRTDSANTITWLVYSELSNGKLLTKDVQTGEYNQDKKKFDYITYDQELYQVYLDCTEVSYVSSDGTETRTPKYNLISYTWEVIQADGWDNFIEKYGYTGAKSFTVLGEEFDHNLQWFAENWDSTEYNPELSHLMVTMANAAYTQERAESGYGELGLIHYAPVYYDLTYADYGTERCPFNIGYLIEDDSICVLISIKGSGSIGDTSQGFLDWMGNLTLKQDDIDGLKVNENFYNTMENIYNEINNYMFCEFMRYIEQMDNVKYFITGHSRGAAVGNLLERKIGKIVGKENVFGYNYAVPDYITDKWSQSLSIGYENIFNLSHIQDEVSYLPSFIVEASTSTKRWYDEGTVDRWCKLGVTVWFDDGRLDEIGLEAHVDCQKYYVEFLRKRYPITNYTNNPTMHTEAEEVGWGPFVVSKFKNYATYCPVDVELLDERGNIIASVIDGKADYHGHHFGEIVIITEDDHKMFLVPATYNCTLRIVGYNTGAMDYYVTEIDINKEKISAIKRFENVTLENGKEMVGKTVNVRNEDTKTITKEEKLFLADKTTEILENGEEIKCIVKYILGDSDNSGKIDVIDATAIQKRIADIQTPYDDKVLLQGDADGNGKLEITDVTVIQRYLADIAIPYLIGVDVV